MSDDWEEIERPKDRPRSNVLIRPPGFARRAGETHAFTKKRKQERQRNKTARKARRGNR